MKTAVSLPDGLFEEAERFAQEKGLSRSELFARALRKYLESFRTQNIKERINDVCRTENTSLPSIDREFARKALLAQEWSDDDPAW